MKGKKPLFKSTGQVGKGKARTVANVMIKQWMGASLALYEGQEMLFREESVNTLASSLAAAA
jgi:hypothetical protein